MRQAGRLKPIICIVCAVVTLKPRRNQTIIRTAHPVRVGQFERRFFEFTATDILTVINRAGTKRLGRHAIGDIPLKALIAVKFENMVMTTVISFAVFSLNYFSLPLLIFAGICVCRRNSTLNFLNLTRPSRQKSSGHDSRQHKILDVHFRLSNNM